MSGPSPFTALGNVSDTAEVQAQVEAIVHAFAPGHDLKRIDDTFKLVDRAFEGGLPGYRQLLTQYHDRSHTNEVVLCSARMLDGMHLAGLGLDPDHIDAALMGALLHDVGYLMTDEEASGTGAQFTDTHVRRGVEFAHRHLSDLPPQVMDATTRVILLTDHRKRPDWVRFDNPQQQRAAHATASADLIGQMANRQYLERLLLLYFEFDEAQTGGFADVHDLLEKTADFYRVTKLRLDHDLNGLASHLTRHFSRRQAVERNFYVESIDRNLDYLDHVVKLARARRLASLRRGGVVARLRELKGGL